MSKELVISSNAHETKVAILEEDQLVEIYFQRANEYSLAGSIHKGRVTRVLPGMQSAFVDLGLERDTFLYVSDFFEENGEEYDRIGPDEKPARRQDRPDRQDRPERSERSERSERREPQGAIQPPPPVAAAETEAPVIEEEVPQAEPVVERVEDDGRDRRGRRSRRRRSRGRGFPDSKYAGDLTDTAADGTEGESFEAEPEAEVPAEVFLLPGESLAKYREKPADREPQSPRVADADVDEAYTEMEAEADTAGETAVADADTPEPPPVTEPEPEAPEPPIEEPPAEEPESASGAAIASVLTEDAEDESTSDAADMHSLVSDARAAEAAESDAEVPEVASAVVDNALPDADALDAEGDEADADAELEGDGDAESDVDVAEVTEDEPVLLEAAGDAAEPAQEEQPREASVRDSGGRYPHRQSRRMRRKRERQQEAQSTATDAPTVVTTSEPEPVPRAERSERQERQERPERERPPLPSISDLLREGQEIIVQIAKEPLGQKGARITSHIALPGRFVVFMPTVEHLGVSRKIASDEERQRLKRILQAHRSGTTGGFIVRTAGEGRTEEEIAGDMAYLYNLWLDIRTKAEKRKAPVLLHHDLSIVHRILRDQLSDMFKSIWIDNEEVYESVLRFMQRFQPSLVGRVKMYTRPAPIFDAFGITQEIEKGLRPKVWLKSGGYIVINQTEALVAIDVNTGKYVGKSNRLEDTITRTNTDAVKEIVRQIRLRDLGGIIVIDFIDMDERKNRQKVMQALEEAMRADRAPYKILQFNDFGLVAITRKRVKQSLERALCAPCPTCEGAGYTKSVPTVVGEIIQEATKVRSAVEGKNVVLRVYPDVAKHLKSNSNDQLEEIESILGRPVLVQSDAMLHPEKFDLAW